MPKISILVAVYNTVAYLPQCLDSLLSQTLKDIEVLCVDDASTDKSLDILYQYAEKDDRVKVFALKRESWNRLCSKHGTVQCLRRLYMFCGQ